MIGRTYFIQGVVNDDKSVPSIKYNFYLIRTYKTWFAPKAEDVALSVIRKHIEKCGFGTEDSVMITAFNRV